MNHHQNHRPDAPNDRRPHDRFGDNYEPRRERNDWREPDRDDRRRFDSPWDQPHDSRQASRRRHDEDDDRRRGFRSYGDYAGSDRGRGYGAGRPEAGRAEYYSRGRDSDDNRRQGYHPEGTSGFISDQGRANAFRDADRHDPRRGYDDARNLPARGDFDRDADRFYENYRDDYTRRDEQPRSEYRRPADRDEPRRSRYDGSNRDGARSDYGYGDDYSSSLYDPTSRNSAFRRPDDDQSERRSQPGHSRRWTDSPDLDNQRRR